MSRDRTPSQPTPPTYLTVQECAALLRVDHKTVRAAINEGRITVVRIGRLIRIPSRVIASLETQAGVAMPKGSPDGS